MYLSIIEVKGYYKYKDTFDNEHTFCYSHYEQMHIPFVIGKAIRGFARIININRLLPVGHRFRGDVLV